MKMFSLLFILCLGLVLPTFGDTVWVAGNAFSFSVDKTVFASGEEATILACTTVEVGANQSLVFPTDRYMSFRFGAGGGTINSATVSIFSSRTYTGTDPGNILPSDLDDPIIVSAVSKITLEYEGTDDKHFVTGDVLCLNIDYTAPTVSVVTPLRIEQFNNLRNESSSEISALIFTVNP